VAVDELRSRSRDREVVRARELLMLIGVERYCLRVVDLAQALGRSPDGMTKALARGVRRRKEQEGFLEAAERLDHALARVGVAKEQG
jgi:chromosomal replication initiation ATPase DnaA